jgi:hypothetical protein
LPIVSITRRKQNPIQPSTLTTLFVESIILILICSLHVSYQLTNQLTDYMAQIVPLAIAISGRSAAHKILVFVES